jgi:hypothetical protein
MQQSLSTMSEPKWLSCISAARVAEAPFPLHDVLRDSLYYPSSGFDGDPVRHLAGNVLSFVYVDYGHRHEELDAALESPGFSGYEIMARRDVTEQELTPCGWTPSLPISVDGEPSRFHDWIQEPFCTWIVMQRIDGIPSTHGPTRFSLLYLCADGVAAFQALYVANSVFPKFVAVIQPGQPFGGNWTNPEDQNQIFARSVLNNPAGVPEFLLYGGINRRGLYRRPCWEIYGEHICFLEKAGGGSIGVWRRTRKRGALSVD